MSALTIGQLESIWHNSSEHPLAKHRGKIKLADIVFEVQKMRYNQMLCFK